MGIDDCEPFHLFAERLSETIKKVIFVDQIKYIYEEKEDMVALLTSHITENLIKVFDNFTDGPLIHL